MNLHRKNELLKQYFLKKMLYKSKRKRKKKKVKENNQIKDSMCIMIPPSNFSMLENFNTTYKFLEELNTKAINDNNSKENKIIVDLRKIERITQDTLMYLKHIGYYIKEVLKKEIMLCCFLPKKKKLKKLVLSSEFYRNNKNSIPTNKNYGVIHSGNFVDTDRAANMVDIISAKTKKNITNFSYLYNAFSELMENTMKHAYDERDDERKTLWYSSFEEFNNKFCFVFLDTGKGIPATIYKEEIKRLDYFKTESELLLSALKGEGRTRTKEVNRGIGLPSILEMSKNKVSNMKIISNKACYNLNDNKDLDLAFKGTLYYWEIDLGGRK